VITWPACLTVAGVADFDRLSSLPVSVYTWSSHADRPVKAKILTPINNMVRIVLDEFTLHQDQVFIDMDGAAWSGIVSGLLQYPAKFPCGRLGKGSRHAIAVKNTLVLGHCSMAFSAVCANNCRNIKIAL
jgi:hypothetical protein